MLKKIFGLGKKKEINLFSNSDVNFINEYEINKKNKIQKNNNINLEEVVNVKCNFRKENLLKSQNETTKDLMFSVNVKDFEENSNRLGLDLLLILDISGSMYGERLNYLKETCYFIIDELEDCDRISIICYDNKVDYISNFVSLNSTNKEKLKKIIKDLEDRSSTNIKLAIKEGFNVLKNRKFKNDVTSIFLLTDGEDTCGNNNETIIKEFEYLNNLFLKEYKDNIIFNTFGYGSDHDSELLSSLSEKNGNYFYIKDIDTIADCFVECLGPMISILCKNTKIKINFKNNIKLVDKYSHNYDINENSIKVNTIGEGMNRYYFCKIYIPDISNNINELLICDYILESDSEFGIDGKFIKKGEYKVKLVNNENEIGLEDKIFSKEFCKIKMSDNLNKYYDELKKGNMKEAKLNLKNDIKLLKDTSMDNSFLSDFDSNYSNYSKEFEDSRMVKQQIECLNNQKKFVSKKLKNYNKSNEKTRNMRYKLK